MWLKVCTNTFQPYVDKLKRIFLSCCFSVALGQMDRFRLNLSSDNMSRLVTVGTLIGTSIEASTKTSLTLELSSERLPASSFLPKLVKMQTDLHVFVQVHRLVVNVVLHEEVVYAAQKGHLWQGEDVHELFHGVTMRALQDRSCLACFPHFPSGHKVTKEKRPRWGRHLSIEVAHDLQGHVAAFVHGNDLLVADRVETPAGRRWQQCVYYVSESARKLFKNFPTCRRSPAGCSERHLFSSVEPNNRGEKKQNRIWAVITTLL